MENFLHRKENTLCMGGSSGEDIAQEKKSLPQLGCGPPCAHAVRKAVARTPADTLANVADADECNKSFRIEPRMTPSQHTRNPLVMSPFTRGLFQTSRKQLVLTLGVGKGAHSRPHLAGAAAASRLASCSVRPLGACRPSAQRVRKIVRSTDRRDTAAESK